MSRPQTHDDKMQAASDALYRALEKWDAEMRSARNLRIALGTRPGRVKGPTITRGTKRSALVRYLAGIVVAALDDERWDGEP